MEEKNRKLWKGRIGGKRAGEDKKRKAKGTGEKKENGRREERRNREIGGGEKR